jgi:hypothetical protein
VHVPEGTELTIEVLQDLSSGTSVPGQTFRARLAGDVLVDGRRVIPAGALVDGTVVDAVAAKKIGGKPRLTLGFERIALATGRGVAIDASVVEMGKSTTGKDAATIGGATAAGAVVGHQVDDDKGKVIGAIVGGAIGAAVASRRGEELEIAAGTTVVARLDAGFALTLEP